MSLAEDYEEATKSPDRLRWYAVKMNETRHWSLDLLRGRLAESCKTFDPDLHMPAGIYATYLWSPDVGVHICSLQRSAELYFCQSHAEWASGVDVPDEVGDCVSEWILEGDAFTEPVDYFDYNETLRNHPVFSALAGPTWEYVGSTAKEDPEMSEDLQALLEHESGNPTFG
jgi:hypothetical protein